MLQSLMIKNPQMLEQFERDLISQTPVDLAQNFQLINSMYELAHALGVFPLKNPLEGIEDDIALAKALNSVRTTPR
ncbi:hypothetical protein JNK13_03770 [bacterium]|nr:hypothetical protein [bacterium]